MLHRDPIRQARLGKVKTRKWSLFLYMPLLIGFVTFDAGAAEKSIIIECSGTQRAYNPTTKEKLPATAYTRLFKIDEDQKSVSEYLNDKWAIFDASAQVDSSEISARYSRDYPDARIDILFELNRTESSLIYLLDIDERPGELFMAHCQTEP